MSLEYRQDRKSEIYQSPKVSHQETERVEAKKSDNEYRIEAVTYLEGMFLEAEERNISFTPDCSKEAESVREEAKNPSLYRSIPENIRNSENEKLRRAGVFYRRMIKPSLATGRDAYTPSEEELSNLMKELAAGETVNTVMYYALSKTRSPRRTGSPDTLIDYAELEMLKHYALMTGTARELGFDFRIVLVDETSEIESDELMGFKDEEKRLNRHLAQVYLESIGAQDKVIIRQLNESVRKPLGGDFEKLYEDSRREAREDILRDVDSENVTPGIIRIKVLLDVMPDEGLRELGCNDEQIFNLRENLRDLKISDIDKNVLNYLIDRSTHISAIMNLRPKAEEAVNKNGQLDDYPEYQTGKKLYGGVTRTQRRWSFMPHPTRWKGRTINPMHGLSIYDQAGNYHGVVEYKNAVDDIEQGNQFDHIVKYGENEKPIAVIKKINE